MKKKKKEDLPNVSDGKKTNRLTQQEQPINGNTTYQDSAKNASKSTPPSTANPTTSSASASASSSASSSSSLEPSLSQQTSPIWERRNFGEIKALNVPPVPTRRKAQ